MKLANHSSDYHIIRHLRSLSHIDKFFARFARRNEVISPSLKRALDDRRVQAAAEKLSGAEVVPGSTRIESGSGESETRNLIKQHALKQNQQYNQVRKDIAQANELLQEETTRNTERLAVLEKERIQHVQEMQKLLARVEQLESAGRHDPITPSMVPEPV